MTDSNPYETEDIWIEAFQAFPDVKPLVKLLRNKTVPMPLGARDQLAEMLSPGVPALEPFLLEMKPNRSFDMNKTLEQIEAVHLYGQEMTSGKSSQDAAEDTGHKYARVSGRHFYRYLKSVRALVGRLQGANDPPQSRKRKPGH
jgi:hypothetical protein